MQSHRIISGLTILAMVVVVAAGWFLFAQPQVAAAQAGAGQLAAAQTQVASAQDKVAALREDTGKLPELQAKLAALQASIPSDIEAASFVYQLAEQAAKYGVVIASVSVSDPLSYAPPVPASSGAATPAPSASATPAPTASAVPAAPSGWTPPADAAITSANFVTIPVNVTFDGSWGQTLAFLQALQTGSRLYLVDRVGANAAADDGTVEVSTSGLLFATTDPAATRSMIGLRPKSATPSPAPSTAAPISTTKPTASPSPSTPGSVSGR